MSLQLTADAATECVVRQQLPPNSVLQILNIKIVTGSANGTEQNRYRVVISDGKHYTQAMAATVLNQRFADKEFEERCVVRIRESVVNSMSNGRTILIILAMDLVSPPLPTTIGSPSAVPLSAASAAPAAPAPAPAAMPAPPAYSAGPVVRQPIYGGGGGGGGGGGATMPIRSLNPYSSQKWAIKARVTSKSAVKEWTNARGSGKLFSIDLLDEEGGEIRGTFFNTTVDKFEPLLQKDKVYIFSGGKLKLANKQYTSIKHDYEVTFEDRTTITPVDDDARIALVQYAFIKLNMLESAAPGATVDVVGVVTKSADAANITSKKGQDLRKRDITLADETNTQITVTLWGEKADLAVDVGQVLALKGAKLGDYGGRSISSWSSTGTQVDPPQIAEAAALRNWWLSIGADASGLRSLTERGGGGGAGGEFTGPLTKIEMRRGVSAIRDESLGHSEKGDLIIVKASVAHIRSEADKMWYPACPNMVSENKRSCNKKMVDGGDGNWSCPNCGPSSAGPTYRYILSVQLQDTTGMAFTTFFDQEGTQLLGKSASDMNVIAQEGGGAGASSPAFEAVIKDALFREMLFSVKVKMETVKDEQRIKGTVVKMRSLEYPKECKALLDAIGKFPPTL